jgi:hypothetical protein
MFVILILISFYICEKFDEHEENNSEELMINKEYITEKRGSRF